MIGCDEDVNSLVQYQIASTMRKAFRIPKFWLLAFAILFVLMLVPPSLNLALVQCSANGNLSAVNHLLAIDAAPSDDALGAAAYNGRTAVVRSLLTAGANPNAINDIDETALAYAAENGRFDIVKFMLAGGADPNWGCREKDPLICARDGGYPEIVKILKQYGAKE